MQLSTAIYVAGFAQLSILVASSLVPIHLKWNVVLASLPHLVRQLFWIYGGYVVLAIISLGLICLCCAEELASGSRLSRCVCAYMALFWGIRLSLQPFLDASPFLTRWWLRVGYHLLTVMFTLLAVVFAWGVFH